MLTLKKDNFCLAYVESGKASEAYRIAFNAENMKPETIHKRASELLQEREVAGRIAELRQPVIEKAQITLEEHLNELKKLRDYALANEKYGPAIQAEIARGKASGLYIERVETGKPGDFENLSDDELERRTEAALAAIEAGAAIRTAKTPPGKTAKAKS
jgi:phage terminase small subunit